jgi:hypothetical protein
MTGFSGGLRVGATHHARPSGVLTKQRKARAFCIVQYSNGIRISIHC